MHIILWQINLKIWPKIVLQKAERLINIILISGVFTAPRAGVYLITFSYRGYNAHGKRTEVYMYKNGGRLDETRFLTYYTGSSGQLDSTGGRSVYQRLEAGDTLTLQTDDTLTGDMTWIIFCVQFINN